MRSRNLKPGFFRNDVLATCSESARLLFEGLWLLADREGRLEDRPLWIKGQIFPFHDRDVDALLNELSANGFVVRYEADSRKLLCVPNFLKHQRPHINEAQSILPGPPCNVPSQSGNGQYEHVPRREAQSRGNQESEKRESGIRNQESERSADSSELSTWLGWWNRLRAMNLVCVGVDAESPSKAVRAAWNRVNNSPEVRACLADPEALEKAICESTFCQANWFTLPKLFGGTNKTGEYIIVRLLEGGYRDSSSGKKQRPMLDPTIWSHDDKT